MNQTTSQTQADLHRRYILTDVSNYNSRAHHSMSVTFHEGDEVSVYIGGVLQVERMNVRDAHFYIMGMMIERHRCYNEYNYNT